MDGWIQRGGVGRLSYNIPRQNDTLVAVYGRGQTLVDIFNTAATRRRLPDWINPSSFFWASAMLCLNLNPLYEKPVRVARSLPSSFPFSRLCPTQVNPLILIHVK